MKSIKINEKLLWRLSFLLIILVYGAGVFVELLEPDAALYAEVSREMVSSGNYLNIMLKGLDWLDKPHFQFWVTAFFYRFFGITLLAYKLPAILFIFLAAYYTYLFALRYYSEKHAKLAALILLTAQHIITSNMDVRAEPFMTAFTIMGLFHVAVYLDNKKIVHLFLCSAALAVLMMTKGLFTIIPVAAAVGCTLLVQQKWKEIFHWQWLLCVAFTLICISPTLYGYYQQFDMHPEKWVFDKQGVSGIGFFLIDSQWGRFVNSGPIKGSGDPFFFVHTLLWAFLPWAWIAYYALFQKAKNIVQKSNQTETYTFFGFIVMFLIFSISKFQLAHYMNPIFPLLAVISAAAIIDAGKKALRILTILQFVVIGILFIAAGALIYFFQDAAMHLDSIMVMIVAILLVIIILLQKQKTPQLLLVFVPIMITLSINYYLNREFYPRLTQYQAQTAVADYYLQKQLPIDQLVILDVTEFSTSVKLNKDIPVYGVEKVSATNLNNKFVYTTQSGLAKIDSMQLKHTVLKKFGHFHITMLTGTFINKATRASTLEPIYLLKVE